MFEDIECTCKSILICIHLLFVCDKKLLFFGGRKENSATVHDCRIDFFIFQLSLVAFAIIVAS